MYDLLTINNIIIALFCIGLSLAFYLKGRSLNKYVSTSSSKQQYNKYEFNNQEGNLVEVYKELDNLNKDIINLRYENSSLYKKLDSIASEYHEEINYLKTVIEKLSKAINNITETEEFGLNIGQEYEPLKFFIEATDVNGKVFKINLVKIKKGKDDKKNEDNVNKPKDGDDDIIGIIKE